MRARRIYTGSDDRTHVEDLELPEGWPIPVQNLVVELYEAEPDHTLHSAPRLHVVIVLEGTLEIECADGLVAVGSGEVLLADDTTGEGHITRFLGRTRVASAPVATSIDVDGWRKTVGSR